MTSKPPPHSPPPQVPPPGPVGLLIIDTPLGPTSAGVCAVVKHALRRAGAPRSTKVGHAGTLDPLATGIIVVLIGRAATRLSHAIMAGEKRYLAEVDLSRRSTTDDREGETTDIHPLRAPSLLDLRAACDRFVGAIEQAPPAHSAIRLGGTRAYELARAGELHTLAPRTVVIYSIDILDYAYPIARLDIRCAKGVYIRSLARDLGRALTGGGMLLSLRRTQVGPYTLEHAVRLDSLSSTFSPTQLMPLPNLAP